MDNDAKTYSVLMQIKHGLINGVIHQSRVMNYTQFHNAFQNKLWTFRHDGLHTRIVTRRGEQWMRAYEKRMMRGQNHEH